MITEKRNKKEGFPPFFISFSDFLPPDPPSTQAPNTHTQTQTLKPQYSNPSTQILTHTHTLHSNPKHPLIIPHPLPTRRG